MNESTKNPPIAPTDRCRLVLMLDGDTAQKITSDNLTEILQEGDVASIIFSPGTLDETDFQPAIEPLVQAAQSFGVAAIVAGYSRTAGRVGADGFQLGQDPAALSEAIEKFTPKMMIGAANVKTRHNALVIGELQPDYVMFGKPGGDIRPEPHPKNLDLGNWWSTMVEIPCIVPAGTEPDSALDVAKCGADFVAMGAAIFVPHEDGSKVDIATARQRIKSINKALDDHAPRFEIVDA